MESPDEAVAKAAEDLAAELWHDAETRRGRGERSQATRMARLLSGPQGRTLILALTDEVLRVKDPRRAARVLRDLTGAGADTSGLGRLDRLALQAGSTLAAVLPWAVIPAVRARVRAEMSGVILPAAPRQLARHAARRRRQGIRLNVNVLGEAVLGEDEAEHRLRRVIGALSNPAVDYVSVKISSICSQLDVLAFGPEVERIGSRLRRLYDAANRYRPPKFVNLDMEEYRDLDLTIAVFQKVLDEPAYASTGAGIVLQAYLPDSLGALGELCAWARARHARAGGWIKVRIVKGANLAMEHVDAEQHGWPAAPFETKAGTDANFKRMLDLALHPANQGAVRIGVASHNFFEVAWAAALARERQAIDLVEFEMLEGMSPAGAEAVAARLDGLLLYAPLVERGDLESAIAYLVRRLDENSGPDNFIAHQFSMTVGSPSWEQEAERFRLSVADRHRVSPPTRRTQDRATEIGRAATGQDGFVNEPDTDFTVGPNRVWAGAHLRHVEESGLPEYRPVVAGQVVPAPASEPGIDPSRPGQPVYRWASADAEAVATSISAAGEGGTAWRDISRVDRRRILLGTADALARRRGRFLAVMAHDTGKTIREGDPEVSEAVDFAAFYAEHIPQSKEGFRPYGTVVVASPWNFPLSIPAGGVLAALAAGNGVILKPAPEAVAVAGELVEALWEGGVPRTALQFVPCVDGDASRALITDLAVDAVVLTGSWDTARLFLSWRPGLNLHAETSGKNAIVITATADLDQAIADLLHSAFGHAGQKCSAASLAIVEADVYDEGRFLRRLADAARSLRPGPAWDLRTTMGPLIRPPEGPLLDAFSTLGPGERWLVRPEAADEQRYLWSPGVKVGVQPGSPFHLTECFGPVLGVMRAADLDEAITWQNQPAYGLTAGLQALDPAEINEWRERVEAGNLYVNRGITGAIVQRQPFGGWKRSVVGPGAKAGGPNYVASLGTWESGGRDRGDPDQAWRRRRDPVDRTGLASESNAFRYRPLRRVDLRVGRGVSDTEVALARASAAAVGCTVGADRPEKVRFLGSHPDADKLAAMDAGYWVDDIPVGPDADREVPRWVREQAVSESRHRHGNVIARRSGLA